jgi:hypothetical protein
MFPERRRGVSGTNDAIVYGESIPRGYGAAITTVDELVEAPAAAHV